MDSEENELRNPLPSPPSHYARYTNRNLELLTSLRSRISVSEPADQRTLLQDEADVPEWPLLQLEKPRVDWILEDEEYNVFGETWLVSINESPACRILN